MNGVQSGSLTVDRRAALEGLASLVIESQLWVAAAVTSLSAHAARHLGITRPEPALWAVFFSTLFIYNLDRSLDLAKKPRSAPAARARWLTLAAAFALAWTLAHEPLSVALLVLGGGAVCSLYAVPLTPGGFRIKDVPGTKSIFVGLSVACAVILVPLAHAGLGHVAESALWLFAFVATLTTINATLFDVRDLHVDLRSGLASLPVLLGEARARGLSALLGALGFGAVLTWAPELRVEAAVVWALCTVFCLKLSPSAPRAAYAWLVDGALFVPWLLGR